jgi:arylsulfatase A-like enzyme
VAERKLNFIIVVSDTFRCDLLSGFRVRGKVVKVPHLSKLASESAFFTRAYAASFPTVPHRHDLLTGKFTFTYSDWEPLPRGEVTLPMVLKEAGYVSMMVADTPHILKDGFNYDRGFDGWVWVRGQENDQFRTSPREVKLPCNPAKLRSVETTVQHLRNNALRFREEDWIPAKTATEAMHWLEENYRSKPFLLYVDFFDPHEPWDPPRWLVDALDPGYSGEEVIYPAYGPCDYLSRDELEHIRALYAAEALLVDKWIGRLLEKVEELGLFEDTAVIFTSDHGFYLGEHGLVGKSIVMGGYHGYAPLYEEVARVPLLIRLPDSMGVERVEVGELAQPPDITATVLELAGLNPSKFGVQGKSLLPYITGEAEGPLRGIAVTSPPIVRGPRGGLRPTVTSYDGWSLIIASAEAPSLEEAVYTMVVDGVQRVLKPFGAVKTELYNLKEDPGQARDLAKERGDVVSRLHGEFLKLLRELGAREELVKPFEKLKI